MHWDPELLLALHNWPHQEETHNHIPNIQNFICFDGKQEEFLDYDGVLTPIAGYLWPPSRASAGGSGRVEVGTTNDFPAGQGKVVPVNDKPVIVVNTTQGEIKAFSAICTHLGCIVEWDQSRQFILCPCHDGRFNPVNGAVISGPPPAPLAELALTVEGDTIYVSEG